MSDKLERIRNIVQDDYTRIVSAKSPFEILNVSDGESLAHIEERYDRLEKFYRAENFQRLGDLDLTRRALDIRRAIGRAINELRKRGHRVGAARSSAEEHDASLFMPDGDRYALGEIYLRDGMTFLQLGDLTEACSLLGRAVEYNSEHGIALAYLGYVTHKSRPYDSHTVTRALGYLDRAAEIAPNEPDIFVLRGRFFAKQQDVVGLRATIKHIEQINPAHPMLDRLQRKLRSLT